MSYVNLSAQTKYLMNNQITYRPTRHIVREEFLGGLLKSYNSAV